MVRRTLAGLVALIVVGGGTGLVVAFRTSDPPPVHRSAPPAAPGDAADWLAAQLGDHASVACDQAMCTLLRKRGVPQKRLHVVDGTGSTARHATLVVSTPTVRGELGTRLDSGVAPDVIGIFGSGPQRVEVRLGNPRHLATLQKRDLLSTEYRRNAGNRLLRLRGVHANYATRKDLALGYVDGRVTHVLAVLAEHLTVNVSAFSAGGPGAGFDIPRRGVTISALNGVAPIRTDRATRAALHVLRKLPAHWRPAHVRLSTNHESGGVLRIRFDLPTPFASARRAVPRRIARTGHHRVGHGGGHTARRGATAGH